MPIQSILIANRGEIAVRIVRACRLLDIRSIAVFSEADEGALWTRIADEAHCIGPAPARDSYLDIDRIVSTAKAAGADAVHPGYGLLSESPEFAEAVQSGGLVFIGPMPETIARMGDKRAARLAAMEAGVPVLPGSDASLSDPGAALAQARSIGWPVVVKASFGGGGRGMRVVRQEADLGPAMEQAAREAESAFGRGEIYLERYLDRPRHVEVQILGDGQGAVIHLGDRDCSVQRRHQKLVEEAPAPALGAALRARILEAAIRIARREAYRGAGTVEFLVDPKGEEFFFLEMNTRLQVEHGVTEMVTGIDIVREQIRIAGGEALGVRQEDVRINGCAIQARVAAEDPWQNFRPAPSKLERVHLPTGPWLRLDFGFEAGDAISPHYDSMFGKVQAWGANREEARLRLASALGELEVAGPSTTAAYLHQVIEQPEFAAATHDTASLEGDWHARLAQLPPPSMPTVAAPVDEAALAGPSRVVRVPWGAGQSAIAIYRKDAGGSGQTVLPSLGGEQAILATLVELGPKVIAPMDCVVVTVPVSAGARVARGDTILILEAMKMEVTIEAPHDGIVETLHVTAGETVRSGALLAVVKPA